MIRLFGTARHIAALCAFALIGMAITTHQATAQDRDAAAEQASGIPQVTVTSQRTEQDLQAVPIAVTAFDATALDRQQIGGFSDLQFATPNVTFTKTNFTATNFQIRGIGTTLTAASADSGVGIHVNDVPLNQPRLFETEYYDIDRVEILRGPQGTLFGRNATAGVANMHTAKPELDEFRGHGEFEYGNFDSTRFEAMVNIPVSDKVALRLAGNFVKRDGYTKNLITDGDIDGRDSYSLRGSIRIQPTDRTDINLMVSWFDEESNRSRSQKQMCNFDPTAILGCLPDTLEFETANPNATLGGILISNLVLGEYALTNFFAPFDPAVGNPADLRENFMDFDPVYNSDELLVILRIDQEISDNYSLHFVGGYHDTQVNSNQQYFNFSGVPAVVPDAVLEDFPLLAGFFPANNLFPLSAIDPGNSGVVGGHILRFAEDFLPSYDQSFASGEQWTGELRLESNYDGPFNFQVGAFYLNFQSEFDYYVAASTLDYFALVGGSLFLQGISPGLAFAPPYFNSETDAFELDSWALFADGTYDFNDEFSVSAGIRFTHDKKFIRDRQFLLDSVVPLGTQNIPLPNASPLPAGVCDPRTEALDDPSFCEDEETWKEVTGRIVLNWTPTDTNRVYVSYSRGYKGGGFNPPSFTGAFDDRFDPEFINAFEIGSKNTFADNTVQANLTGFYYDYGGLQVGKIVDRTSVNENIDAKIWGFEAEFFWAPDENWLINANASFIDSKVKNASSIDGRDPSDGRADVTILKDFNNASNCVIHHNGGPDPLAAVPAFFLAPTDGPIPTLNARGAFGDCGALIANTGGALDTLNALAGAEYTVDGGVEADLDGNELQYAPDFSFNIGVQYTHYFGNGLSLSARVDYYYQSSMFARIFNKDIDKIDSWDVVNAQITLQGQDESWYVRGFIKNIANSDNITGQYFTDPSSGNFTNVFVLEPRRYGVEVGANF